MISLIFMGMDGYGLIRNGYLDIWISGYLDSGKNNVLVHPQSGLLCGAALLVFFFTEKTGPGALQPKTVFFLFYQQNL